MPPSFEIADRPLPSKFFSRRSGELVPGVNLLGPGSSMSVNRPITGRPWVGSGGLVAHAPLGEMELTRVQSYKQSLKRRCYKFTNASKLLNCG